MKKTEDCLVPAMKQNIILLSKILTLHPTPHNLSWTGVPPRSSRQQKKIGWNRGATTAVLWNILRKWKHEVLSHDSDKWDQWWTRPARESQGWEKHTSNYFCLAMISCFPGRLYLLISLALQAEGDGNRSATPLPAWCSEAPQNQPLTARYAKADEILRRN